MTTQYPAPQPDTAPGTALDLTRSGQADPAERGVTTIADTVVEKIAARAAIEIENAAGLTRRIVGRALGAPAVRVSADIDGQVAVLRLQLALDYPAPARQVTRAVRQYVKSQVSVLCGIRVDHIDIVITALRRSDTDRKRVQ